MGNGRDDIELRDSNTNTDSDRVLMTKRAVFFALRDLMAERDFQSITAGDIMERAGVSRSTFYRCFADKFDVVNWSYKRYKNIRVQDRDNYHAFRPALRSQLLFLQENQAFYAAALRYVGQNSLRDSIFETNEEYMAQCWREAHGQRAIPYPKRTAIAFAAAGCAKTIERWVLEGCVQPPDDVVEAVCASMPPEVLETLF